MAKRKKNRKSSAPNLPQATLERARRQAAGEDVDAESTIAEEIEEQELAEEEEAEEVAVAAAAAATPAPRQRTTQPRPAASARRRSPGRVQASSSRRQNKGDLDNTMMQNALAHPTKYVSEEQLQEEYGYVVMDIRNMGILAGGLMVVLVLLAQFI